MSRNEGRFEAAEGIPTPEDEGPPAAAVSAPTQFNWSVPTEFVELPSKGKFYTPGHPVHNVEAIEIKYMTAKEEDILSDRALLKKGMAVDRALQNLIVDKNIKIENLLIGDKNALLVAARKTGFGPEYTTRVTCPSCGDVDDHTFDLDDIGHVDFEGAMELEEVALTERNTFKVTLPMTKVEVECKMLLGKDESVISKKTLRQGRKNENSSMLVDTLALMMVSLNGNEDKLQIIKFANQMPARDSRYLRTVSNKVTPNVDMSADYECMSCGATAALEVPLTADFFWPK